MDVFPDVIAYGILLLPKGIKEGERRPVVVCQHGLEGRPRDVADPKVDNPAYHQLRRPAGRARIHHVCTAESLHFRRPLPHAPAQGQPDQEDAVLGHRPAAPADHRLAQNAAVRGPGPDRLLRAELRGQVGDADPAAGEELLPVDLLGRLQRVGVEERVDPQPLQLRLGRRVRDLRVRPGEHVQLRRDGRPDRPAAVHGRAWALRRRRARRDRGLRVRQGISPLRREARASATAAASSSSSARTRSTARARSTSCIGT